jgi:uracil-DNA glycosylase
MKTMTLSVEKLTGAWREIVAAELEKEYMRELLAFLEAEERAGKTIYPPPELRLNALVQTPLEELRVVILGQDPYVHPGEAMGLSFSVPDGVKRPKSLTNIVRRIEQTLAVELGECTDLTPWARQGVLLLNSVLSVERGARNSHAGRGWERFTDALIEAVNQRCEGVVFLLWGNPAREKGALVDRTRHHVLETSHPSPLGHWRGFNACNHFAEANALLERAGRGAIDWASVRR